MDALADKPAYQKKNLINEDHKIIKRGKNHFVENFENKLVKL